MNDCNHYFLLVVFYYLLFSRQRWEKLMVFIELRYVGGLLEVCGGERDIHHHSSWHHSGHRKLGLPRAIGSVILLFINECRSVEATKHLVQHHCSTLSESHYNKLGAQLTSAIKRPYVYGTLLKFIERG
jgi:hypothetical protein